ncbi:MAG: 4Fe-4S binding protein, partial [Thermovirgaceae bacterium]|nr:4Fe-4S binding protein [Thermovirgaceae bacterium]
VAGLEAALGAAEQGYQAYLVEQTGTLGGVARKLRSTWRGEKIGPYLEELVGKVEDHPKVQVFLESTVKDTSGIIGNFTTTVVSENGKGRTTVVEHGATILATGGKEYKPTEYLYGEHPDVLTHLDLDEALLTDDKRIKAAKTFVFIQCVGSRVPERPYCSKICCTHSLESALTLKKANPNADVYILYRDMRMYALLEDYYRKAREQGVLFLRYPDESPPEVENGENGLRVRLMDSGLRREVGISPDILVLSAGIRAEDTEELASIMKLGVDEDGFLMEAHVKLRPVDMATDGIFVCGTAHSPKLISESISQAMAAVSRAATFLSRSEITLSTVTAKVDQEKCASCLVCVMSCPYGVPKINKDGVSEIDEALCRGCGVCAAECPAKAIELNWYEDDQILCKVDALLEGVL